MPAHRLPGRVQLGDGDRLHLLGAVGRKHRVRGVDRHAHARQLVLVHLVAAALGQRLAQAHHLDARLQGVVGGDQADVAAADDEQPFGGPHHVAVDQGLEGAGAVDPGQACCRGTPGTSRGRRWPPAAPGARPGSSGRRAGCPPCGPRTPPGRCCCSRCARSRSAAPPSPAWRRCPCRGCRRGRPRCEPKNLWVCRTSLPPRLGLVVHQDHPDAGLGQFDGRRQPGGPAAQDQALHLERLDVAEAHIGLVHVGQRGLAVQRAHRHAFAHRHHAGLHRQAVGDDRALGALAVGAEDALGRAVLGVVAEHPDAVGEQGRGDGLPLPRLQRPCPAR